MDESGNGPVLLYEQADLPSQIRNTANFASRSRGRPCWASVVPLNRPSKPGFRILGDPLATVPDQGLGSGRFSSSRPFPSRLFPASPAAAPALLEEQGEVVVEQEEPPEPCDPAWAGLGEARALAEHWQAASEAAPQPHWQAIWAGPASVRTTATGPARARIAIAR